MLKFIWKVLIWTWIIDRIQNIRGDTKDKDTVYDKLSLKIERLKREVKS